MSQSAPVGPPRKRKVRIFTSIILAINVLFAVWLDSRIVVVSNSECTGDFQACDAAEGIGGGIGALLIVFLWMAADVILGIIWLVTRKREPAQVVYVQQPYNGPQGSRTTVPRGNRSRP